MVDAITSGDILSPEQLKYHSKIYAGDVYKRQGTLIFEEYRGQSTTIALKLCLQRFLHLRHRSLYVLLPVFDLMKKSHSCFAFFDNLGILKTPFTCLK